MCSVRPTNAAFYFHLYIIYQKKKHMIISLSMIIIIVIHSFRLNHLWKILNYLSLFRVFLVFFSFLFCVGMSTLIWRFTYSKTSRCWWRTATLRINEENVFVWWMCVCVCVVEFVNAMGTACGLCSRVFTPDVQHEYGCNEQQWHH